MIKFLNFIEVLFFKQKEKKEDNSKKNKHKNIMKLLQWGNYSEVSHNSTKQFKN